ncbi:MAG: cytochrome b [Chromatiales bacterium]|nr:cytochrome b [Chromatiales bacterium]
MLRNTATSWGLVSRNLHWLIAAMIAVQVPLGFWMNAVYNELVATKSFDFSQLLLISRVHHTNGFLILILTTLRLTWRVTNPTPAMPAGLAAYQRWLARLTHVFLYALLFAFPLSGWATLSAYEGEFPIFFFGWDNVPRIVPQAVDGSHAPYEFYAEIHEACWKVGMVVLALHVAGALWHHVVVKDNVLRRMLRGS